MTKIVWRPWHPAKVVAQLTAMKTLELYMDTIDARFTRPREMVEELGKIVAISSSGEMFHETQRIVILEPESCAGIWNVDVDYEPVYSATKAIQAELNDPE
jgi:hypothetical protein